MDGIEDPGSLVVPDLVEEEDVVDEQKSSVHKSCDSNHVGDQIFINSVVVDVGVPEAGEEKAPAGTEDQDDEAQDNPQDIVIEVDLSQRGICVPETILGRLLVG